MAFISRIVTVAALLIGTSVCSNAQIVRDFINDAGKGINKVTKKGGGSGLSESEIGAGLKEALQIGAKNATSKVSAVNGFFGNALIKVLMPPEAKKVENTLREIGLGDQVDQAILSMN